MPPTAPISSSPGHTHGGQVCVPGYGALVTNCDLDTGRVKGLSRWWPGAGSTPSSQRPGGRRVARGVRRARHRAHRSRTPGLPSRGHAPDARPPLAGLTRRPVAVTATARCASGPIRRWAGGCASISACCLRSTDQGQMQHRGVAQLGSALRSGRRGRRFKSCHPDQQNRRSEALCSSERRASLLSPRSAGHVGVRVLIVSRVFSPDHPDTRLPVGLAAAASGVDRTDG